MKNLRTLLAALALTAGLAACGDSSALVAPEAPRFDSGHTYGSGNRDETTTSTTATIPSTEATSDSIAVTDRGGHGLGSGN